MRVWMRSLAVDPPTAPRVVCAIMEGTGSANPHSIGLTGSFGSGCTYVAKHILSQLGYRKASLSEAVRRASQGTERHELQACGDELREKNGADYLARQVCQEITEDAEGRPPGKWVVDSIRNPAEVHYLRRHLRDFFLFGICASRDTRWARVRPTYQGNERDFDEDDERDTGRQSPDHGQRVEDCFAEADVVILNEENFATVNSDPFRDFKGRINEYVDLVSKPLTRRQPTETETLMAAAYTVSQRSSCLKRKVGAVIVDDDGNIISSGFNEVPRHGSPCVKQFGECWRTVAWNEFSELLKELFPREDRNRRLLMERLRREQHFRMLDICRSLHAEENAIVNLARNGSSVPLDRCTLYTTTYPCRLCAYKVVNLRLDRVVYLQPYPDREAKIVLNRSSVTEELFQGITFKAYSRVYGEKK